MSGLKGLNGKIEVLEKDYNMLKADVKMIFTKLKIERKF